MSDPFKKSKAASEGAAKENEISAEDLLSSIVPEPEVSEPAVPKTPVDVVLEVKIEKPVDVSRFSKQEAVDHIKKQFQAKVPVFVIAKEDGEHPKAQWKKAGQKFKLESAEAYSHRWMKLA
jgi:hypothetical protein